MRKFIISDLHGDGNVYNSIMSYLDKIKKQESIVLYINGDLIDKGFESAKMLLDIKKRIEKNENIIYLAGNHELMMYQSYKKMINGINIFNDDWFFNDGIYTNKELINILGSKEALIHIFNFISNLKIYHQFEERINNKRIVLVHAACPLVVEDECNIFISNDNEKIEYYLWAREDGSYLPFRCRIGNRNYFSIVGHTPNANKYGFEYHKNENYLNIDGGCAAYVKGIFDFDHVPLVEVKDNYLRILTFNNNNEIIYGNYFENNNIIPFSEDELEEERKLLDKDVKIKKLMISEDGRIRYKN